MKQKKFLRLLQMALVAILFTSCVIDGEVGPEGPQGIPGEDGADGEVNVFYSPWYTPTEWAGETNDWYFGVEESAISQDVVEAGIILAYMAVPNDIYPNAVRPLPAYAIGANWDFLIPDYESIEFTCDSENAPGTDEHYFRFIVIPSGTALPTNKKGLDKELLMAMDYKDVCELLNIPE